MNDEKTGESDTMLALAAGRYPNWVDENTLIEVIDPAIKQKLTVPLVNLEHTNGLGTYFLNKDDPKRRESYLCMLYQKNKCKSHLRCNQIHADRDFVQNRRETQGDARNIDPYPDRRSSEVIVTDPTNPISKVVVPFMKTLKSKGRTIYLQAHAEATAAVDAGQTLSSPAAGALKERVMQSYQLCPSLLSVSGEKCCVPGGQEMCPNIHAQTDYLQFLRRPRPCCKLHGDNSDQMAFRGRIFMSNRFNQRCALLPNRVSETRGLRELLAPNSQLLVFNANRACRMFLEGKCSHGMRCSNLHICREFYAFYVNAPNPSLVQLPPPTMPGAPGSFRLSDQAPHSALEHPAQPEPAVSNNLAPVPDVANTSLTDLAPVVTSEQFGIPLATEEGWLPYEYLPKLVQTNVNRVPWFNDIGSLFPGMRQRDNLDSNAFHMDDNDSAAAQNLSPIHARWGANPFALTQRPQQQYPDSFAEQYV